MREGGRELGNGATDEITPDRDAVIDFLQPKLAPPFDFNPPMRWQVSPMMVGDSNRIGIGRGWAVNHCNASCENISTALVQV